MRGALLPAYIRMPMLAWLLTADAGRGTAAREAQAVLQFTFYCNRCLKPL